MSRFRTGEILEKMIRTVGPISVASFMKYCLTNPTEGYYRNRYPFGVDGDFITSPEISQIFGELIGIWMIYEWILKKKPSKITWVELGPGRGTLTDDYLRTAMMFEDYFRTIESLRLIEISPVLREFQRQLLCGSNAMENIDIDVWKCLSKYGMPVYWYERFDQLPRELSTPFIAVHEFFDSMPIHKFEVIVICLNIWNIDFDFKKKTVHGWREFLVDFVSQDAFYMKDSIEKSSAPLQFRLILSKRPTYHSLTLPNISQRYSLLPIGSCIEISPESLVLVEEISKILLNNSNTAYGSALIIDYGPSDTIPIHTLRGIRSHRIVSPFEKPGEVDLSSDVDFQALKEVVLKHDELEVYGPIEQGTWLKTMGIEVRAKALIDASKNISSKKRIESSYKRLIERGGGAMGKVYKFMAIISKRKEFPAGFY
ncbi:hypothetical protein PNEG_01759 [Pneumocystis murina B123]|uniref:Protein arginine methyltransferase NDUFAF7 n=1 Tax=Pneumocystis murina (strain B123) TaxID=1069680 RepID=M7NSA5_PNEMU|nr:hypothetical protein PNEG_01759 [Pneumocystis murina B123]EMR10001.1 hypothetical protein PNEG_01759 [Pneumocystis murina B123]